MLCEKCKKKPAILYFQQIINGEKKEYHLCEDCASQINMDLSFDNMFKGFLDGFNDNYNNKYVKNDLKCLSCEYTFEDFKTTGRVGCADCYSVFKSQMNNILKNIHGRCEHTGKIPSRFFEGITIKNEINKIRDDLKKAVAAEEFEEAARLRDKIKALEGGHGNEDK